MRNIFKDENLFTYDGNMLAFKRTNRLLKYKLFVFLLFISVCCLSFLAAKKPQKEYVLTEVTFNEKINEQAIKDRIYSLPFRYKDIVWAQAQLESSHFKSVLFKANRNIFGMRLAKQRLTFSNEDNLKHAYYKTIDESILDRLLYEAKYMDKLSREEYFEFLDRLYATGDNYSKTLKQMIKCKN